MAKIVTRFADGRLLIQEEKFLGEGHYVSGTGIPVRIGLLKTVEEVLSVDTEISGYPEEKLLAPLKEITTSGDTILVRLRRSDIPVSVISGVISGYIEGYGYLSAVTSGRLMMEEIASGALISGKISILANVIGLP